VPRKESQKIDDEAEDQEVDDVRVLKIDESIQDTVMDQSKDDMICLENNEDDGDESECSNQEEEDIMVVDNKSEKFEILEVEPQHVVEKIELKVLS
jgi:hypothetical protein